ncbi:YceD family protein [Sabulibacter ruber]|uniref:YceD family protein n=1 Tax=Sabulibacter ruber TaxID=2811901 RepID=UPI001A96D86C
MKEIKKYDINLVKLGNKRHEYEFELDDRFFELFSQQLIHGGNLKAEVVLHKSELLLQFDFHITGTVRLTCDRSLEEFEQPLEIDETLHVRFGPEELELDENVLQILPDTQCINLAQHLYDYIGLAVPMKKLHPRFVEEDLAREDDPEAEGLLIYSTGPAEDDEDDEDNDDDGPIDPRFAALKKLK